MAAPRLLDKRVVNAEVATQKVKQAKEGLALAQKVDALRQAKSEEEANLEKFRVESIKRVQTEIDAKISERDSLEHSLVPKREEYEKLLTPPDLTEIRNNLRQDTLFLEKEREEVRQKQVQLEQGIALNIQRERANQEEQQRVETERKRSSEDLIKADQLREDAVKQVFTARYEAAEIMKKAKEREKAASIREQEVSQREMENERVRGQQIEKDKEQKTKDKEIADKYATLQRTISRL